MTITEATSLLSIAAAEVGYTEDPPDSNRTKFGQWFGLDGVAWCGMFVSWCYHKAGRPLGNIGFSKGFAGCQTAVAHYRKEGKVVTVPAPGDIVFFDWNKDGRYDHTGLFVRPLSKGEFETIEGNTSVRNDSNGGVVMVRRRKYGSALFVRP